MSRLCPGFSLLLAACLLVACDPEVPPPEISPSTGKEAVVDAGELFLASARGDLDTLQKALSSGADVNLKEPVGGSTLLMAAAFNGRLEMAQWLLDQGADVQATNVEGSTALHLAAFLCWQDTVELLLQRGADPSRKNLLGYTPLDQVADDWSSDLEASYLRVQGQLGVSLDLERLRELRPVIAAQLQGYGGVRGQLP